MIVEGVRTVSGRSGMEVVNRMISRIGCSAESSSMTAYMFPCS